MLLASLRHEFRVSIRFDSIQYSLIQFNSIQFKSIQFNSIIFNSIQFNSIQINSIQFNSLQFNSIQFNSDICTRQLMSITSVRIAKKAFCDILSIDIGFVREDQKSQL